MYCSRLPGRSQERNQEVPHTYTLHGEYLAHKTYSKRDGLEKAVYRIEQAIKRSRTQGPDDGESTEHLQALLSEAQGLLPVPDSPHTHPDQNVLQSTQHHRAISNGSQNLHPDQSTLQSAQQYRALSNGSRNLRPGLPNNPFRGPVIETESPDDHFSVDDAENPLQLLARASDLSAPTKQTSYLSPPRFPGAAGDQQLKDFFGPFRPSLDIGTEIDPIELGLVTEEEASILFS